MTEQQNSDELRRIEEAYERRSGITVSHFDAFAKAERQSAYSEILKRHFGNTLDKTTLLEVGAGGGRKSSFL